MKGWYAVLPALLLLLVRGATAAENPTEAAKELARRAAGFAGQREAVALSFRSLGPASAADARLGGVLESALRDAGVRLDSAGPVELRVTLSETPTRRLLAGEARRGDDRQAWIVSWPANAAVDGAPMARLDRTLLWEQSEPVLDAVPAADALLVLSPSKLTLLERNGAAWQSKQSVPVAPPRGWPRDPRARLSVTGSSLRVFLPGGICAGTWQPGLTLECRASDDPWPVDSGGPNLLLAHFVAGRNHFDGRIVTQSGARKSVPPFYSAAAVEEAGGALWVFAGLDGRAVLTDSSFGAASTLGNWGSDVAASGTRCHGRTPLVTTRPGQENEALQAFVVANRQAEAMTAPLAMPGPVTALWPAPGGAIAVTRDAVTERHAVYQITVPCE